MEEEELKSALEPLANLGRSPSGGRYTDMSPLYDIIPDIQLRVKKIDIYRARKVLGETIPEYWQGILTSQNTN